MGRRRRRQKKPIAVCPRCKGAGSQSYGVICKICEGTGYPPKKGKKWQKDVGQS
ncbi:MAG: hypothetical protein ACXABY_02610 [Candidatus Thorarchaeota archaeon]